MEKYSQYCFNEDDIVAYSKELNRAFGINQYRLDKCLLILDTMDKVNPFVKMNYEYNGLKNNAFFNKTYKEFLVNLRDNAHGMTTICRLYEETFLKLFVPESQFIEDVTQIGFDEEEIKNYLDFIRITRKQ